MSAVVDHRGVDGGVAAWLRGCARWPPLLMPTT